MHRLGLAMAMACGAGPEPLALAIALVSALVLMSVPVLPSRRAAPVAAVVAWLVGGSHARPPVVDPRRTSSLLRC